MVSCINCNHECHCKNKCSKCECDICEHENALDKFWKEL